jgi:predicted small lipoprotein YifL
MRLLFNLVLIISLATGLAACGNKGTLKAPKQIAFEEQKKARKEAKEAAKKAKEAEQKAAEPVTIEEPK